MKKLFLINLLFLTFILSGCRSYYIYVHKYNDVDTKQKTVSINPYTFDIRYLGLKRIMLNNNFELFIKNSSKDSGTLNNKSRYELNFIYDNITIQDFWTGIYKQSSKLRGVVLTDIKESKEVFAIEFYSQYYGAQIYEIFELLLNNKMTSEKIESIKKIKVSFPKQGPSQVLKLYNYKKN